MKKTERPKTLKREDGVDLISNMPDAILLLILSRLLSTEEQIRSSILSRRWRYLWTAIPSVRARYGGKITSNRSKKSQFKEFVYWVLVNKSVDLDRFELFCSDSYSMSTVWRWINVAVTKNVKQLDLGFRAKDITEYVELPHCLVTCHSLEVLNLYMSGGLKLPKVMGFPELRVLSFSDVDLMEEGELIKGFFESFPSLEDLTFTGCYMMELDLFYISCPKLKSLTLENSIDLLMCGSIKISCPKLVDLVLTGYIAGNIFFECLDSLKKAVIRPKMGVSKISGLFPGISRVEHLSIDPHFFIEGINTARDPALPNLKTLVLVTTMEAFTIDNLNQILKYYPKLEALRVTIEEDYYEKYEWSDDEKHNRWLDDGETRSLFTPDVKRVELFEFKGEEPELVIYWFDCMLNLFFTWGDEARFSPRWL